MKKYHDIQKKVIILSCIICLMMTSVPLVVGDSFASSSLGGEYYHYFTYQEMTDLLFELADEYPDIVHLENLGYTYGGRTIWMVKLSDNASETEQEPGVLLMGAHHGNEKPSFEAVLFFIQHMVYNYSKPNMDDDEDGLMNEDPIDGLDNDQDGMIDEDPSEDRVRDVLNNTQIYCIPMVNPDGVEANTRHNCAPNYGPDGRSDVITSYGVDLNRNYGFRWYFPYFFKDNYYYEWITDDLSGNFRGERPFCEAESKAVKDFVDATDISISLSYHDYGEWMIFPWMHSSRWTPHERIFRSIGYNMSRINNYELKIYGQHGSQEYLIPRFCGTIGSSENWLYARHRILAYTMELCPYRSPSDPAIVYSACYRHVGVNLYICERSWTVEEEKAAVIDPIGRVLSLF